MRCRHRIKMRKSRTALGCLSIAAGLVLCGITASRAETLRDIEGLSVTVDWTQAAWGWAWYNNQPQASPINGTANRSLRLYISSKGNIFEYPAEANNWKYGPTASAIDKAVDLKSGMLMAWTMVDGHLTKIIKGLQGFAEYIIAIDPARMTCSIDMQAVPDPQTRKVVTNLNGYPVLTEGIKVISYSCKVIKGNIFAPTSE